jgi:hypothetical protein
MRNAIRDSLPPTCPRCGFLMRVSRLPHFFAGTCSETFECALCDTGRHTPSFKVAEGISLRE